MDPVLLMLCIFTAGAVVGLLMGGMPRHPNDPSSLDYEVAALRSENWRLGEENERLRAELADVVPQIRGDWS